MSTNMFQGHHFKRLHNNLWNSYLLNSGYWTFIDVNNAGTVLQLPLIISSEQLCKRGIFKLIKIISRYLVYVF